MPADKQAITPYLWFDRQAEEAAKLYASTFPNSRVGEITRASGAGVETTGLTEGTVMTVEFEIGDFKFVALNGGPLFKFNPSISFLVSCGAKEEVEAIWKKLSQGGTALMELGAYPHSEKYGWIIDRYGVSWQVMYTNREIKQKVTPTLMFVGPQLGKTEAAINFYTSVFKNSKIGGSMRYQKGMEPNKEGTIQYAAFTLENEDFTAMDSALRHDFTFSEAISFLVPCQDQPEVDYYWNKFTTDGG
jgi:predicted 3-demethylubiquinone-9 3-methyltransferase (glyoxalase superfamily)